MTQFQAGCIGAVSKQFYRKGVLPSHTQSPTRPTMQSQTAKAVMAAKGLMKQGVTKKR